MACNLAANLKRDPTTHLLTPKGWKSELGLVGLLIVDTLPTKWSHITHKSGVDRGKFASQRPTF